MATLGDYLHVYLPTHTELHSLYSSLLENAEVSSLGKERTEFTSYLSEALIKEGQRKVRTDELVVLVVTRLSMNGSRGIVHIYESNFERENLLTTQAFSSVIGLKPFHETKFPTISAQGDIICGTLHVSRHHPRDEAYLRLKSEDKGQSIGNVSGEVLIYGNINRYGD